MSHYNPTPNAVVCIIIVTVAIFMLIVGGCATQPYGTTAEQVPTEFVNEVGARCPEGVAEFTHDAARGKTHIRCK